MDHSTGELGKGDPKWGTHAPSTEGGCPPPSAQESISKPPAAAQLEGGDSSAKMSFRGSGNPDCLSSFFSRWFNQKRVCIWRSFFCWFCYFTRYQHSYGVLLLILLFMSSLYLWLLNLEHFTIQISAFCSK